MITYIDALALEYQISEKVFELNKLMESASKIGIKVDIELLETNLIICQRHPTPAILVNCLIRPSDITK